MWVLLCLMILLWGMTRVYESYTELTPDIIQLTAQSNQISVEQNKLAILTKLIDNQSEQLNKLDVIISTIKTQKNSP